MADIAAELGTTTGSISTTINRLRASGWELPSRRQRVDSDYALLPGPNPGGRCRCGCGELAPIAKSHDPALGVVKGKPRSYVHGHQLRAKRKPAPAPKPKVLSARDREAAKAAAIAKAEQERLKREALERMARRAAVP